MHQAPRARLPAALLSALLAAACSLSPPVQEMSDARQAIAAAREAGAATYAAGTLAAAEQRLADAEQQLRGGGYLLAKRAAEEAKETAFKALLESRNARPAGPPPAP